MQESRARGQLVCSDTKSDARAEREELLKYAGSLYSEWTPQLEALLQYVYRNLCKSEQLSKDVVDDVRLACSADSSMNEVMYEFERRNIQFDTMEQAQSTIRLIIDVKNHTSGRIGGTRLRSWTLSQAFLPLMASRPYRS